MQQRLKIGKALDAKVLTFGEEHFGAVGGEVDLRSADYYNATDRYELAIAGGANNLLVSDASSGHEPFIGGR